MRRTLPAFVLAACMLLAACGTQTTLFRKQTVTVNGISSQGEAIAGIPIAATKNTTRIAGVDPIADAAQVALAVYPSAAPGTHPPVVALAPIDDWQGALASAVLMAAPIRAPILLSASSSLPPVTAQTLKTMAPRGSGSSGGAQVIRLGDVPRTPGLRAVAIHGGGPYALAAAIDRFATAAAGTASPAVVIASADQPAYAMPAAGWAAESGNPILFVSSSGVPTATKQALLAHKSPHIYVLGPPSVIPDTVLAQLRKYGSVKRVGADDPAANSVAFTIYRDPPCPAGQPCVHVPGSFGWALRSPGHGYVLINANRTLDAVAAAPLSASGSYGPVLLVDSASSLPTPVLNFFLDYATPGFTQEGPTAAVYNHGWVIGDESAISVSAQAEMDTLLEAVPQK
jgi:hypothetical protein